MVAPAGVELGHYQGGHGCLMIPFDKGVCGAAACNLQTQIVDDVNILNDHIGCAVSTRYGLVLQMFNRTPKLEAVLDIDSDQPAFFSRKLAIQLEMLLAALFCRGEMT